MAKRQRTMTDEEIGLVKALITRGLKNDHIHFYFNRADRLISSGRIAQIRNGKYGAAVAEASQEALDTFLFAWERAQRGEQDIAAASPVSREAILAHFAETDAGWVVTTGETDSVECKIAYRLSDDVLRSIAGLANNKGGYVLFGVANGTFSADGLATDHFMRADPADINRTLASALDPVPHFTKASIEINGKMIGIFYVEKHDHAPVIALKNVDKNFKEGAIYFRYVGESRAIKPGELRQIIAMREQKAIAEFSERMQRVATGREATLDLDTGEVRGKTGAFVIDRNLLPNIQFLREGEFTEVGGAPALKLIGDVEPVDIGEREQARIIRDTITPDAVVRNFLKGQRVSDPLQYIHAHAHCQRRWLPVWFYIDQLGRTPEEVAEGMMALTATHPSNREAVVKRLQGKERAYKIHVGKAHKLRLEFARGEVPKPNGGGEDLIFANAVMGLMPGPLNPAMLKPILLECLDRAEAEGNGSTRSAIYRAACRLDELLHGEGASTKAV